MLRVTKRELAYIIWAAFVCLLIACNLVSSVVAAEYILTITFVMIMMISLKRRNLSIYQIFLCTYFLFLVSRVFLDCFGLFDAKVLNLYENNVMDDALFIETCNTITMFLIGSSFAWLSIEDNAGKFYFLETQNKSSRIIKLLQIAFYTFLTLFLAKIVYMIYLSTSYGYLSFFNGTLENVNMPIIFKGAAAVTELLLICLLYYKRDERDVIRCFALFTMVCVLRMLTGRRAYSLIFILSFVYLWSTYYREIKVFNKKVLLFALLIPIVIELVANMRYGKNLAIGDLFVNNIYLQVFQSQGSALNVVADTIKYKDKFTNEVPFFLGYFVDLFRAEPAGQVMEDILYGNYLGDHLTYILNSRLFLMGRGTGTSLVAEAYNLVNGNQLLIMLFGCGVTRIVLTMCKNAYKSLLHFTISFYLMADFIFSPRGSVLRNISGVILASIVSLVLIFFESRSNHRKQIVCGGESS